MHNKTGGEDKIVRDINIYVRQLNDLKRKIERKLAAGKQPEGNLRIVKKGSRLQCYVKNYPGIENNGNHKGGKYLRRSEEELAISIAQRDYDNKFLKQLNDELDVFKKVLEKYKPFQLEEIYNNMTEGRKRFVTPWIESSADYAERWLQCEYTGKNFEYTQQEIYTDRGERVRSKSEKIIADKLYKKGIPYKYEYPHFIGGIGNVYPDFTCLNIATREEIMWEHFGMMGDAEYCKRH